MDLVKVESTNLAAIGYNKRAKVLRIQFVEGSTYDYHAVPAKLFRELMQSESKGQFFQQHVVGKFQFEKSNPREESNQMGQNKAQRAAAERAKAAAQPAAPAAVGPNVGQINANTGKVNEAPAQPSKQTATLDRLKAAWTERKVDLSKMTVRMDGKFMLVTVADGWPVIQIGASGGIVLPQIRSYQKAFDAAIDGLALFQKQQARDQKKTSQPAPPPAAPAPAAKETPTAKKARQGAAVEQQLASA